MIPLLEVYYVNVVRKLDSIHSPGAERILFFDPTFL
jgi:hypothetical protein